jgi:hypothetical protein
MGLTTCKKCEEFAEPGCDSCAKHRGGNYRFNSQRVRDAVSLKEKSDTLFSLRQEVALLRHVIEETINSCDDDLAPVASLLTSQMETLARILQSCQKLEIVSSTVMSIDEVTTLVGDIASIVAGHVDDVAVVGAIASDVTQRLETMKQEHREKINDNEL